MSGLLSYKGKGDLSAIDEQKGQISGKVRKYLDKDVLEAAIERAKYLFSRYDDIIVSFSGGKDSLVVLELMDMVRIELGIKKKLEVLFWDEELISDEHDAFLRKIVATERFNFHWVCAPLKSEKYILGQNFPYVQWDITREFVRTPPDYAIKLFGIEPCSEHDVFVKHFEQNYKNYANCLGLRASESLNRLRAVMRTAGDLPFIVQEGKGVNTKIIYDWTTKDIFKFLYDYKIEYAPVYDAQTWSKSQLRVATPFTSEGAKALHLLKEYDPMFYDRLTTVFPEMHIQERYHKHIDKKAVFEQYGVTREGIYQYIQDSLHGRMKDKAIESVNICFKAREEDEKLNRFPSRFPILYIFENVVLGTYKRCIVGIGDRQFKEYSKAAQEKYLKYEKQPETTN